MRKIIGVGTLFMIIVSYGIGWKVLIDHSLAWGIAYGIILLLGFPLVIYAYCSKCPARNISCSHYFPGKLTGFLPDRESAPYHIGDYLATLIPLAMLTFLPQPWLLAHLIAFIAFWILTLGAVMLIYFNLCSVCSNKHCMLCANTKMNNQ